MDEPPIRVMALHALAYCERLFYLEEVEEIRRADHRVYAGRTLHETGIAKDGDWSTVELESETLGLKGKIDYVRYRDGELVVYEHKRGRSKGDEAWASDRLQVTAYCELLSEHLGKPITAARIRYHANNKTVSIRIDETAREELRTGIGRARLLASQIERPPIAENEAVCTKCSLAPICLPEEERLAQSPEEGKPAKQFFPADDERRILHVTEPGCRIRRSGEEIVVLRPEADPIRFPARDVSSIVLHGGVQISSQTLHYAVAHDIGIHWLTAGGSYVGGLAPAGGVQRVTSH